MSPLTNLRVVDLGSFIAGPYVTQLLGDFGAEIIKIEPLPGGDPMRQWGAQREDGASFWWPVIGRNKKSVVINLKTDQGRALTKRLLAKCDVLVENFRPGTLERLGLDPAELIRENSRLVIARISGFGQGGIYNGRAGFGSVAEAMGGLRFLTGHSDQPPPRTGLSIGDTLTALFATYGIMAALWEREQSGCGQIVDAALTDSVVAVLESVLTEYSGAGILRERTGSILPGIAPSNIYPTLDQKWIVIGANADRPFSRLGRAMGRPELGEDPRYATHSARGERQAELDQLISEWTKNFTLAELVENLAIHGVPAGPVNDASEVLNDPHFRQRGTVLPVDTETGRLWMQGVVPKLERTPGEIRWTGPTLGAHTDETLRDYLGLSNSDLLSLRREGVIA